MNLREEILKEHSKAQTNKVVKWVGTDGNRFKELLQLFLKGEYRVTQRSAWMLSECVSHYPDLILPYVEKILLKTKEPGVHDAVKRNVMRILQYIEVPEKHLGLATQVGFDLIMNANEPIAVRVFSMTTLLNICKREPDLKNELKIIVEEMMELESAAFKSRGRKTLKALEKLG